jgi:tRNA pseudouridine55 synthase
MMMTTGQTSSFPVSGFLVVDKPPGITSHGVVEKMRRALGMRKIGHLGTLDPIGTGVLVLAIGKATKAVRHFINDDKVYLTTLLLGVTTDTQDVEGKVLTQSHCPSFAQQDIRAVLQQFEGKIQQVPPMVSAKKVKGRRLYTLHRKGIEIPREPKTVFVRKMQLLNVQLPRVTFLVGCSKGTYIRTLCADIGEKLGPGGCMAGLCRLRSGFFCLRDARSLRALRSMPRQSIASLLLPVGIALEQKMRSPKT